MAHRQFVVREPSAQEQRSIVHAVTEKAGAEKMKKDLDASVAPGLIDYFIDARRGARIELGVRRHEDLIVIDLICFFRGADAPSKFSALDADLYEKLRSEFGSRLEIPGFANRIPTKALPFEQ